MYLYTFDIVTSQAKHKLKTPNGKIKYMSDFRGEGGIYIVPLIFNSYKSG